MPRWKRPLLLCLGALLTPGLCFADERLHIGRYESRAIFRPAEGAGCPAPLVILVPGSGANGPEEMMPGSVTGDGKEHSLFAEFSEGLRRGHVATLALGKPGIEFFSSFEKEKFFYNAGLYQNLAWHDLLNNLDDAVNSVRSLPCVDPNRVYLLGHSEGTNVVIDYAAGHPGKVRGLLLVGLAGRNLRAIVDWQFFRRDIDTWIAPDVDADHDGFVTKEEAGPWPEFHWDWSRSDRASYAEIEAALRRNPELRQSAQKTADAKVWQEVVDRAPIYPQAAALREDLFILTGTLDVQTVPEDAIALKQECEKRGKKNCELHLLPGLGHGMSAPKAPRRQKLLDSTLGPVAESFKTLLAEIAAKF